MDNSSTSIHQNDSCSSFATDPARDLSRLIRRLGLAVVTAATQIFSTLPLTLSFGSTGSTAIALPSSEFCQQSPETKAQGDTLRQAAIANPAEQTAYRQWLTAQATALQTCRNQSWLKQQAIWLRLYPCDLQPGRLDQVFDRILSQGYNQVYVEVFADGRVVLPSANNRTAWASLVTTPGYENRDLWAEAIAAGRQRGMKVYAWMFLLNAGYTYGTTHEALLARNGRGATSITARDDNAVGAAVTGDVGGDETFIDPYSLQAQRDYGLMVQAVLQRQPDGILFDYVRYPRGVGGASVVSRVTDLWIYGAESQAAFVRRGLNPSGQALLQRYLSQGALTSADLQAVRQTYPKETAEWQGSDRQKKSAANLTLPQLQTELWQLSLAHARQGILDFLAAQVAIAQQRRVPAGAVFFPEGNRAVGGGFDSRLQPWDQFPGSIEWHPMAYANCGAVDCIVPQVAQVMAKATSGAVVLPAIAGTWGTPLNGRPPLETQMRAIRQGNPQITGFSHWALSWQDPQLERDRAFCRLEAAR
jgi:hypothetical protein